MLVMIATSKVDRNKQDNHGSFACLTHPDVKSTTSLSLSGVQVREFI
jgi:hypothetical protein